MSQVLQQNSQEFKTYTVTKRGRDKDIRVPQLSPKLTGDNLRRKLSIMAFKQANEDRDKATALLRAWIDADHNIRVRILDWDLFCREGIDEVIRSTRPGMRQGVTNPSEARMSGIQKASQRNLMEYPIRPDLRLGDATKKDLERVSREDKSKGITILQTCAWYDAIVASLPNEKCTVRVALKEADLDQFLKRAQKKVA